MDRLKNYINGKWAEPASGKYFDCINPATNTPLAQVPDSNATDVDNAVLAAQKAFPAWSELETRSRAKMLRTLSRLIEENEKELALLETTNTGKPLSLSSTVDIPRSAYNLEFYADSITQFSSEYYQPNTSTFNIVTRQPLGVVACISPWNLPLYLFTWKIAPALAAGNTVIAKPSEVTPLTAYKFSELCMQAGLPPGVLNILHGTGVGVGTPLVSHPEIKAISFTGSTQTGRLIYTQAANSFKKVSLEMGGKNPTLIFADADFDLAVNETTRAAFTNQGQICLCGSRVLVEEKIYDRFKEAFVKKANTLVTGDPLDPKSNLGSVVSKEHYNKILNHLNLAKQEGAKILTGGGPLKLQGPCANGYFIPPTIIEGLPPNCTTNQEEIFGPVCTLIPFLTTDDAISIANSTQYGLSASVFTQDINTANNVASKLNAGVVWINTWMNRDLRIPFGGVKNSGLGREGGFDSLKFFTETKTICTKINL